MQEYSNIPLGLCQCGCGQKTAIITESHPGRGLIKGHAHRFVHGHYARLNPIPRDFKTLAERFWSYVRVTDGCWIWEGYKDEKGYGVIEVNGKNVHATHISLELDGHPLPPGLFALHNCPGGDEPACVRPSHLFPGTHQENMTDMVVKGRSLKGAQNPRSKLTTDAVLAIRAERRIGVKLRVLAERHHVTISTINQIMRRATWAWLMDDHDFA